MWDLRESENKKGEEDLTGKEWTHWCSSTPRSTWHLPFLNFLIFILTINQWVGQVLAGLCVYKIKIQEHGSRILITNSALKTPKYSPLIYPSNLPVFASRTSYLSHSAKLEKSRSHVWHFPYAPPPPSYQLFFLPNTSDSHPLYHQHPCVGWSQFFSVYHHHWSLHLLFSYPFFTLVTMTLSQCKSDHVTLDFSLI